MWAKQGRKVVHSSGLEVEVLSGSFENPMDLSVNGGKEFSAPQLALMIREGIAFAVEQAAKSPRAMKKESGRPILKLKKTVEV